MTTQEENIIHIHLIAVKLKLLQSRNNNLHFMILLNASKLFPHMHQASRQIPYMENEQIFESCVAL